MYGLPAYFISRWLVELPSHVLMPILSRCVRVWWWGWGAARGASVMQAGFEAGAQLAASMRPCCLASLGTCHCLLLPLSSLPISTSHAQTLQHTHAHTPCSVIIYWLVGYQNTAAKFWWFALIQILVDNWWVGAAGGCKRGLCVCRSLPFAS